jgi:HK97 family phage prohead protease
MAQVLTIKKPARPRQKFLSLGQRKLAPVVVGCGLNSLLGKAVYFDSEGQRVAGKIVRLEGNKIVAHLAVPRHDGILVITDIERVLADGAFETVDALTVKKRVAAFEGGADLVLPEDKKFTPVFEADSEGKPTGIIVDYQNVTIEGHGSTFGTPEKLDRGGEYVMSGAWNRTLTEFRKNPVILTDHQNSVKALAGSWTKVSVDAKGLGVQGSISNAPGVRDTRFKIVERHLKGLSIGGIWHYANDGRGIEDADLYEISLVAMPMNPETLFHSRSLGEADCRKAFAKFWRTHNSLLPT